MDWFTAKELMDLRDVSKDKLITVRNRWFEYWVSYKTVIASLIIWVILCIGASYYSINWLNVVWLLLILWAYWKEKELNWYIEGYQDWYSEGTENMQKQIWINTKSVEEMYYWV